MAEITGLSGATATDAKPKVKDKSADLGKNDFLKLLITQLRFQDPMEPMEDKEFIAQMAQFNSLEEMQTLNRNLSSANEFAQLTQASGLIGKTVSVPDGEGKLTGKVVEVRRTDGELKVMVKAEGSDQPPKPFKPSEIEQVAA